MTELDLALSRARLAMGALQAEVMLLRIEQERLAQDVAETRARAAFIELWRQIGGGPLREDRE